MPGFLDGLNPAQRQAVTEPPRHALILAGAGSGKTRVLTSRIAHLIQTGQASPHGILAVTFTNKAAKEMLARLSAMLPINTRGMWVGTFHGLCNRMLRAHHREALLPELFQILDSQDQLSAVKRVVKALNLDDEKYPPRQAQWFINNQKEQGLRAAKVPAHDGFSEKMREIYATYEAQCQREGVVDFAELLLRSVELLAGNPRLREHYQARFTHLLVDEFQDTNPLQYQWLKLLAGPGSSLFAVGDDDQSIYAFRGARAAHMQEFMHDFAVPHVIKLEQNYRSHGNILDAANALIQGNAQRLGKNLWTEEGAGEPIRVYQAATDLEEAEFIVDEARALRRQGANLADIAILYRSNAQSRALEHALFSAGLAYRVYGGLRFFERAEIKHALAYLRLLANPDDDTALLRIINFPTRGIGARSIEQLQDLARQQNVTLWQAACSGALSGKAASGISAFAKLILDMQAACRDLPLGEVIDHVLETSGLRTHYKSEKDGADRLDNLDELLNAAAFFIQENDDGSLAAFLTHASLEAGEHQADAGTDALQLMTAHAAKGLEFHTVFITGLEEGLFPHANSLDQEDGIEEERRLMYVAITRARRRLYITHAETRMLHGQTRYGLPSRFLDEIPEALVKSIGTPARSRQPAWTAPASDNWDIPLPASKPAAGNLPFRIGQSIIHPKFGAGVVLNYEGSGADARVQVKFRDVGVKWLALAYAKLAVT